jgi:hypothetical protein
MLLFIPNNRSILAVIPITSLSIVLVTSSSQPLLAEVFHRLPTAVSSPLTLPIESSHRVGRHQKLKKIKNRRNDQRTRGEIDLPVWPELPDYRQLYEQRVKSQILWVCSDQLIFFVPSLDRILFDYLASFCWRIEGMIKERERAV